MEYGRRTNRQFNYVPRYYNEDMEDLHERADLARQVREGKSEPGNYAERIRDGFRLRQQPVSKGMNQARWVSRLRTLAIAFILGLLFYLLFYTDVIYFIFEVFQNA